MRQTLHILKKDARRFRLQIACMVASAVFSILNGIFWIVGPGIPRTLMFVLGVYLTARVIHEEAIPSEKGNWLTRPYRWEALLAAKLLFIFFFVLAPCVAAYVFILAHAGFAAGPILWGTLIWGLMVLFVLVLPAAGIAALTDRFTSFVGVSLIVATIGTAVFDFTSRGSMPSTVHWAVRAISVTLLGTGVVAILWIQYRRRRTLMARVYGALVMVLVLVVFVSLPVGAAMSVQSLFSEAGVDHSSMKVVPNVECQDWIMGMFCLDVAGIPTGLRAHVEAITGEIVSEDGQRARFDAVPDKFLTWWPTPSLPPGTIRVVGFVHPEELFKLRGKLATIRGTGYITLAESRQVEFAPTETPIDVLPGVRCGRDGEYYVCRTMAAYPYFLTAKGFEPPSLKSANAAPPLPATAAWNPVHSYSPFPRMTLIPYDENHLGQWRWRPARVDFTYDAPVSHFRLDFDTPVTR
jgi:hypothetical protein